MCDDLDLGEAVLSEELFEPCEHQGRSRGRLFVEGYHATEQLRAHVRLMGAVAEPAGVEGPGPAVDFDELKAAFEDFLGFDPYAAASGDLDIVPLRQGPDVEYREFCKGGESAFGKRERALFLWQDEVDFGHGVSQLAVRQLLGEGFHDFIQDPWGAGVEEGQAQGPMQGGGGPRCPMGELAWGEYYGFTVDVIECQDLPRCSH